MELGPVYLRAAELIEREGWIQGFLREYRKGGTVVSGRCAQAAIIDASKELRLDEAETIIAQRTFKEFVGGFIGTWNDAPERTLFECTAKLREAAANVDAGVSA